MAYIGERLPASILSALYHLENVNDSSGNSKTLTAVGSPSFSAGKFANALDLGTSNSTKYVYIADKLGMTNGACSFGFWVKLNAEISSGTWEFCRWTEATTDTQQVLYYEYNSGTRRLTYGRNRFGVAFDATTYNVTMGTSLWYYIVYTYDGSTVRLYVNGAQTANTVASTGNGSGASDFMSIGANYNAGSPNGFASAMFDEAEFYPATALTASQIRKQYAYATGRLM